MATTKKSRPATRPKTTTSNSEPSTTTTNRSSARSGGAGQKRRTTSAKRSASTRRTTSAKRTTSAGTSASRNGASRQNGSSGSASDGLAGSLKSMGGTVVHGMDRAKPAFAVGATAVGIAGGIALRRRQRSTLPFGLPRNGDGIDIIAISKAVGKASARFGQTAKSVSKDIDTAADRAERIGKILS
jgi:hypothetical protein